MILHKSIYVNRLQCCENCIRYWPFSYFFAPILFKLTAYKQAGIEITMKFFYFKFWLSSILLVYNILMFTVRFFFTDVISQRSREDVTLEHTDFTVTQITGSLTCCPLSWIANKNIYCITFYREISLFLSTNFLLTQNS